ncbi:Alpha/Beta hydrolase protein [Hypoxylon rubiginosum]|uniref:Alpha/Beta hydrolase protein n=1 Tax=Hypoxylon rubiginosum TaxID=110542 RepID=A0ACC0DIQ9_9PEZI|nr:Alpha/Beta hydrolase protein [Hypoxylon rubiginosum]
MHRSYALLSIPYLFIGLRIDTTVGTVEGFVNASFPGLKQWLGIPFAEPPVGSLRWKTPVEKSKSSSLIEAKTPPNSCSQYLDPGASIFNDLTPQFLAQPPYSEDCLYLNVITPIKTNGKLPVLVWVHGGEFLFGGINTAYENPRKWVERSQSHIVVMINYRLNIFGFPNAKGLTDKNFGVLDQRLAIEWVRDNIKQFGGDPEKITLWGQSAGSAIIDGIQFAWPSDPIFRSVITESGVTLMGTTSNDMNQTSFDYVSKQLGCSANNTAQGEVECMQKVDADLIEEVLFNYTASGTTPALYFGPQADGKIVFTPAEYLSKGEAGDYANVPMLVGSNAQEGSSFVPFSVNSTITTTQIATLTDEVVQCPVAKTCKFREDSGRLTYRYFYAGNFTNISPVPWVGAYHFAELPLVMGTHSDYRTPSTPFETSLSHLMQDMWLAFVNDPHGGLKRYNWAPYSSNGTALVLGKDNVLAQPGEVSTIDAGCSI